MHLKSGLLERRDGRLHQIVPPQGLTPWHSVVDQLDELLQTFPAPPPLMGHSVHFERQWLMHVAPELKTRFLYQNMDARGIESIAPTLVPPWDKKPHRALLRVQRSVQVFRAAKEKLASKV